MNTTTSGNRAEDAAADYLARIGYEIIEQNWKTRYAEIDIVARKDKTIYFAEVKYRKTTYAGDGFDYITPQKLHHMQRAAEGWVLTHHFSGEYALLGISVVGELDTYEIELREIA